MTNGDDADLRAWFSELVASDPLRRLQEFREHHPGQPLPPDLEFAARYEAILCNEDEPSGEEFVSEYIDKEFRKEKRPGAPHKPWHAEAFMRIDSLVQRCGMSKSSAIEMAYGELEGRGIHLGPASLQRQYERYRRDRLIDEIARAVLDGDREKGIAALAELRHRDLQDGRRSNVPKK